MTEKSHVGMARCFFCLKEDQILLETRIDPVTRGLRQTLPRDCGVVNMIPCHECEGYMKQGILLISVRAGDMDAVERDWKDHEIAMKGERHPHPFIPNPFRTGGWCVVKQEAVERWLKEPLLSQVLKCRWCFVEDDVWNAIGLPREETLGPERQG